MKEYIFFSALNVTFSETDHLTSHRRSINRYKKIEIIPCILSDHHGLKLVFNSNKNNRRSTYTWKLNNALLNDNLVKEDIKKLKTFLVFNENIPKFMGHDESSAKRKTQLWVPPKRNWREHTQAAWQHT